MAAARTASRPRADSQGWRSRYFVLRGSDLAYFASDKDFVPGARPRGRISLRVRAESAPAPAVCEPVMPAMLLHRTPSSCRRPRIGPRGRSTTRSRSPTWAGEASAGAGRRAAGSPARSNKTYRMSSASKSTRDEVRAPRSAQFPPRVLRRHGRAPPRAQWVAALRAAVERLSGAPEARSHADSEDFGSSSSEPSQTSTPQRGAGQRRGGARSGSGASAASERPTPGPQSAPSSGARGVVVITAADDDDRAGNDDRRGDAGDVDDENDEGEEDGSDGASDAGADEPPADAYVPPSIPAALEQLVARAMQRVVEDARPDNPQWTAAGERQGVRCFVNSDAVTAAMGIGEVDAPPR